MPFRPQINDTLQIDGAEYRFTPHPVAKDMPYGQQGRRATVYQVEVNHSTLLALKVFTRSFRSPGIAESASRIRPYASVPGLQVCARLVVTPEQHAVLLEKHPDLKYACLMPWVMGATWQEVMLEDRPLTEVQSLELSFALVRILATMEQKGLAHCDLSGPNIILPGLDDPTSKSPVALVDVEEMYGTTLSRPEKLSAGSPGYAHKAAARGIWNVHADRFAGAIILAEMLCWCDEEIRKQVYGEQFFDPAEIHQDSERYRLIKNTLEKLWGTTLSNLFNRTWHSERLEECPSFIEWGQVIFTVRKQQRIEDHSIQWKTFEEEIAPPLEGYLTSKIIQTDEASNSRKVAESMLAEAGKMEVQGRVQDAINLYKSAKALLERDDPLHEEIDLIVFNLSENVTESQGQSPTTAVAPTVVEQPVNVEKPSQSAKRRMGKSLSVLMAGGILAALFVMFYFGNNLPNNFLERIDFMVASLPTATATISVPPQSTPTTKATSTTIMPATATLAPAEIIASPTPSLKSSNILLYETTDDEATISIVNSDSGKSEKIFTGGKTGRPFLSPSKKKMVFFTASEREAKIQIYDFASRTMNKVAMETVPVPTPEYSWDYPNFSWSLDEKYITINGNGVVGTDCAVINTSTNTTGNVIKSCYEWSPNVEYVVCNIERTRLDVCHLPSNSKNSIKFSGVAIYGRHGGDQSIKWLDNETILLTALDIDQTIIEVKKINIKDGAEQQIARVETYNEYWRWDVDINPSRNKAVIYRTRAEYTDVLLLDISTSEAKYNYEAGERIIWSGWTRDSSGIFLRSEGVQSPIDFPELVLEIPGLRADGDNYASSAISPVKKEVAVLLCAPENDIISVCHISIVNDKQDVVLTTAPQLFYVDRLFVMGLDVEPYYQGEFSWSLDGSSLAYIVQQDGKPMLAVLDVKNNKQRVIAEVSEDTKIIWLP